MEYGPIPTLSYIYMLETFDKLIGGVNITLFPK